jgi:hypothetical protein
MNDQKPTGVFVRLPLSNEQLGKLLAPIGTLNERMISIGTPVTGGELQVVAYDNIASGYLSRVEPVTPSINLVRQSDAQAQIAALEAEVVRLREENERLNRQIRPQFFCSDILEESSMDTREGIVAEARDYDDDLQAFTIFEMEGYAKVHKSYGFYDHGDKCHWFDTEAEALSAVAGLKGGAA